MTNISLFQQSPPLALVTKTLINQNLCTKFLRKLVLFCCAVHGYFSYNSPIQYIQGIYMSYMAVITFKESYFLPFILFLYNLCTIFLGN